MLNSFSLRVRDASGVIFAILITHEPMDQAERKNCRGKTDNRERFRLADIQDDELPHQSQECNEHDRAHLNNALLPLKDAKDGVIELERDQHSKNHAEQTLKDRLFGRINQAGNQQYDDPDRQVKKGGRDHDTNERREAKRNNLLEAFGVHGLLGSNEMIKPGANVPGV